MNSTPVFSPYNYSTRITITPVVNKLEDLESAFLQYTGETLDFDLMEFIGTSFTDNYTLDRNLSATLYYEDDTVAKLVAFLESKYSTTATIENETTYVIVTKTLIFHINVNQGTTKSVNLYIEIKYTNEDISKFYNQQLGLTTIVFTDDLVYTSYDNFSGNIHYAYDAAVVTKLVSIFETATGATEVVSTKDGGDIYHTITHNGVEVAIVETMDMDGVTPLYIVVKLMSY